MNKLNKYMLKKTIRWTRTKRVFSYIQNISFLNGKKQSLV